MYFKVPLLEVFSLLLIIVAGGIINLVLLYRRKQIKHIKDNEQLSINFENKLLQTKLEIQEQTFKTISQEIHDNIGQMLTLVKLNLNVVKDELPKHLHEKISESSRILSESIQGLRDISKTLNSEAISNAGLITAIEMEIQLVSRASGLQTSFTHEKFSNRIDTDIELILFRIVQEALHNVMKHANATRVDVLIENERDVVKLSIKDNGIGFNAMTGNSPGTGLINIRSRCKLINASFDLTSKGGAGTALEICVPAIEKLENLPLELEKGGGEN